ncbi:MAG: YceI family protein [Anaerolineae bacterium]|jgi:polyisoprenoid-binding protein YceI|nr:MAG: YceI family protein [Anaerolineae bacterium]
MSWKIDTAHSEINFTVRHMMISNVRGRFERFEGTVEFDEQNPTNSSVEVKIEAASINTREPQRDAHLRSPDFLDVEKYPYLIFKSKKIEVIDSNHGRIIGDLTIRDVTREVTLEVEYNGTVKSPFGNISAGFSASTTLNRKDWGLQWNVPLETGGWLVGENVHVQIEIEMIQEKEAEAVA